MSIQSECIWLRENMCYWPLICLRCVSLFFKWSPYLQGLFLCYTYKQILIPCLCIKFHKSLVWVPIWVAEGLYLVPISLKFGSLFLSSQVPNSFAHSEWCIWRVCVFISFSSRPIHDSCMWGNRAWVDISTSISKGLPCTKKYLWTRSIFGQVSNGNSTMELCFARHSNAKLLDCRVWVNAWIVEH